jgi:hypothetical protein
MYIRYLHKIFTLSVFDTVQECIYNIYKASLSPGSNDSSRYNSICADHVENITFNSSVVRCFSAAAIT